MGSLIGVISYLILSRTIGDRSIAMIGLALLGFGSVFFGMINLEINLASIALPNLLYGAGIFLALTPLIPLSCSTVDNKGVTNATGLQNLLKNIGGAIGTSISTTMVSRCSQMHQMMMSGHLNYTNDVYTEKLCASTSAFLNTVDSLTANYMAQGQIYSELIQQSRLWAYIDTFRWFAFATFLLIPMLLLVKKPKSAEIN